MECSFFARRLTKVATSMPAKSARVWSLDVTCVEPASCTKEYVFSPAPPAGEESASFALPAFVKSPSAAAFFS